VPLTLVATAGDPDANAYIDVDDADELASYRVGVSARWDLLTDDQKTQALVTAASEIDTLEAMPGFLGDRATADQPLAFPRTDLSSAIPAKVAKANAELAFSYMGAFATGSTVDPLAATLGNGNIKRDKVGPIETEYFAPGSVEATAFERLPAVLQRLLYEFVNHNLNTDWGSAVVERTS
jgi:hypothetical protein